MTQVEQNAFRKAQESALAGIRGLYGRQRLEKVREFNHSLEVLLAARGLDPVPFRIPEAEPLYYPLTAASNLFQVGKAYVAGAVNAFPASVVGRERQKP